MSYVRVAVDTFHPGAGDDVLSRVKQELVPILERQPGFVAYEIVKTGEDSAIFINTWETNEQAEAAVRSATQWVRDNVAGKISTVETYVGELCFSRRR